MKKTTLIYVSVVFALGASVLNVVSSMHNNVVPVYLYLMTACLLVTVVLQCILFKKLKDENVSADEEGKKIYSTILIVLLLSAFALFSSVILAFDIITNDANTFNLVFMLLSILLGIKGGKMLGKYKGQSINVYTNNNKKDII